MELIMKKKKFLTGQVVWDIVMIVLLGIFGIICLYPVVYLFSCSISRGSLVDSGQVLLWPKEITFSAYEQVVQDRQFWVSYRNTLYYTGFGSLFSMLVSTPAAYVLSKPSFRFRKQINMVIAFTMWFTPGFIPLYLNYSSLGVVNSMPKILISFGVLAFNIILLRNYFEAVPVEMDESAKIDGASDFTIFWQIYLPLSKPSLATVWLYYAMGRWNGYFWSMILLRDMNKIPLQVYLKQKVIDQGMMLEAAAGAATKGYSYTTVVYALVVCSMIPVLILFPYIQKYFTKGVMVGAVKG